MRITEDSDRSPPIPPTTGKDGGAASCAANTNPAIAGEGSFGKAAAETAAAATTTSSNGAELAPAGEKPTARIAENSDRSPPIPLPTGKDGGAALYAANTNPAIAGEAVSYTHLTLPTILLV